MLKIIGNDTLHKANPWEFLINKKYHLVWCNVFKAASTSWMYNFNLLAGYSPQFLKKSQMVPLTLARKKYGRPSLKEVYSIKYLLIHSLKIIAPYNLIVKWGIELFNKFHNCKTSI